DYKLMGQLMYGAGLRLSECLSLRVKDIDFDPKLIIVRDSKGKKDRVTPLPEAIIPAIRTKLQWRRTLHQHDMDEGTAEILRLEQILRTGLEPRIPVAHLRSVDVGDGTKLLVIRIGDGWLKPHHICFKATATICCFLKVR
ncbi:MAG: tyrosine-type recombinase/integrase, partial [Pirellulales bacterium]|nr:tyrosine-type recombinase/integrase [Pirellulales bacterium]